MWRFVSAARMAQIKADARAEGYIKAVREGLAANDAAKDLRSVTRDNTHAANTAVQEMKAEMKQAVVHKKHRRTRKASYNDPHIRLIFSGVLIEEFIFKHIGKLTTEQIVKKIIQDEGTHIRGYRNPIKVTERTVEDIMGRRLVWDEDTNIFLNVYSRNRK